jgi:uncharacterized protein involved in exopolysaccharide biosynthesis
MPGGWSRLSGLSFIEFMGYLWARKFLMLAIFTVVFSVTMAGVLTLKKTYFARGKILVQFGEEYIYNPIVGTAGQGTAFSADQMIQAEVGFITSNELKERVLNKIGLRRLYPKLAMELEMDPAKRAIIHGAALHELEKGLGAFTAPNQPLVNVTFRHNNPVVARDVLQAFIEEYQVYRREVLLDTDQGGFEAEQNSSEKSLQAVNKDLERFLARNGIGDFVAERTAMGARIALLRDQLLSAELRRQEIESALPATATKLAQTPKTVEQYTDDTSSGQLDSLRLEREQLLAKYLPTSSPVREIDARIVRMEQYMKKSGGASTGTKRIGVNTIYQSLLSSKLALETEQKSNAARISVLKSQIAKINTRQRQFQKLFPQYQRLASRAKIMETNYEQFASREQEMKTRRNLAALQSDNIRVIERPTLPVKGKSMKRPATIAAFLFAAFTAISVGLFAALLTIIKMPAPAKPEVRPAARKTGRRPSAPPFMASPPAGHQAPSYPYIQTEAFVDEEELPVLGNIPARQ